MIDSVSKRSNISKQEAAAGVESVLETIKQTLAEGEKVVISSFGKFDFKEKKQRKGRTLATGSDLILDARKVFTFKCSGVLRDKLNGKG